VNGLPAGAGAESARRLALAEELVRACPPAFAGEIALTGSAALGAADRYSDLELNFWPEALPPAVERAAWLRRLGATDVVIDLESGADATLWSTWRTAGIWVEAGWQTVAAQQSAVETLLGGGVTDHDRLVGASAVLDAVPLRIAGRIASWQQALARYPDGLADALIAAAVQRWRWPHWVDTHWALVDRSERLGLADLLVDDLKAVLRVLFAVNRRWETSLKWLLPASRALALTPERLTERVEAVFVAADAPTSVRLCSGWSWMSWRWHRDGTTSSGRSAPSGRRCRAPQRVSRRRLRLRRRGRRRAPPSCRQQPPVVRGGAALPEERPRRSPSRPGRRGGAGGASCPDRVGARCGARRSVGTVRPYGAWRR
jgi:hypothetical protein